MASVLEGRSPPPLYLPNFTLLAATSIQQTVTHGFVISESLRPGDQPGMSSWPRLVPGPRTSRPATPSPASQIRATRCLPSFVMSTHMDLAPSRAGHCVRQGRPAGSSVPHHRDTRTAAPPPRPGAPICNASLGTTVPAPLMKLNTHGALRTGSDAMRENDDWEPLSLRSHHEIALCRAHSRTPRTV